MEAESEIKIARTWDVLPPTVYDGDTAFSTRFLERRYRKMEEALILIRDLDYARAAVNLSALKAVELAREALTSYK